MNDKKPIISTKTVITSFAFLIGLFLSIVGINAYVDNRIDNAINDPEFLEELTLKTRIPFLIFDEKGRYLYDTGALCHIDNIEFLKNDEGKNEIIITTNTLFLSAPILQSLDGGAEFEEPRKGTQYQWHYIIAPKRGWAVSGKPQPRRYKLEIIERFNK